MSSAVLFSKFPPEYTEEKLGELARSVGPFLKLKLAFDDQTGRSKCQCVVQFLDVETASSAVRNLHDTPLEGGRSLKCVFVDDEEIKSLFPQDYTTGSNQSTGGGEDKMAELLNKESQLATQIPPLPLGISLPSADINSLNAAIYNALVQMDQPRLELLITEIGQMLTQFPDLGRVFLKRNPQMVTALVQAALLINRANPNEIKDILNSTVT